VPGGLVIVRPSTPADSATLFTLASCTAARVVRLGADRSVLEPVAERRIMAALAEPTSIAAAATASPLPATSRRHRIPILLNERKLNEAGVSSRAPVTTSLAEISLASALRRILNKLELTYIVRHEALIVTTFENADRPTCRLSPILCTIWSNGRRMDKRLTRLAH
jgi:hypothetical protein